MTETNNNLTKKDMEVFESIKRFALARNYVPTFREIASMNHLKSPSSSFAHVSRLIDAGYLFYDGSGCSRSLVVKGLKMVEV